MVELATKLRTLLANVLTFAQHGSGLKLRNYQEGPALAIVRSVLDELGLTFVVMFPRQSGKNELQAQIECYLLTVLQRLDAEMVKVSPTWKPQSLNAMRRLERVLTRNLVTWNRWTKERGYIYRVGDARIFFLSGAPTANVVGATAWTLLQCDEAQDVLVSKWDKDFAPMAASTNGTKVFWGTAWTSRTLLARELRAAKEAEKKDGIQRVFTITGDEVAEEVPAYANHVEEQINKLGRNHPLVKTQYFCEEIDAEGGMFPRERQAMMRGKHPRLTEPEPDRIYAFLVDVAGEDEGAGDTIADLEKDKLRNPGRDSTTLTIVEVDISELDVLQVPTYRVMDRRCWVGVAHTFLYGIIKGLADVWSPRFVVVDATGVGAGLSSFLERALPSNVLPFLFTPKSKSDLGWKFLAVCDTGRFKDHKKMASAGASVGNVEQELFWQQVDHAQYEALENKMLRWSVPDGTRDLETGELVHDDLVISAALCGVLDDQEWSASGPALVVQGRDPLVDMDQGF
jgi:hypothetical protein